MMDNLQNTLKYRFKDINKLKTAVTHSSYANEVKRREVVSNERYEFLGDSILGMVVAQRLFSEMTEMTEGSMSRLRAELICEKSLHEVAKTWELGRYMRLGRGEEQNGGRERPSILADAVEAVIAAVFLDGGLDEARKIIEEFLINPLMRERTHSYCDYKTELQELIQKNRQSVKYNLIDEQGPDHRKVFFVEVTLNGSRIGEGEGNSKKEAEQNAARAAIEAMGK
jgi:ribonuclease-3